jgi:hypothetical protein
MLSVAFLFEISPEELQQKRATMKHLKSRAMLGAIVNGGLDKQNNEPVKWHKEIMNRAFDAATNNITRLNQYINKAKPGMFAKSILHI